jgi:uncharacterized membrane protein
LVKIRGNAIIQFRIPIHQIKKYAASLYLPSPHSIFILICGLNSIVLTIFTPPFQIHDELQHFFRSYQISEVQIWGAAANGRGGGVLPSSLNEFVENSWGTLRIYYVPPLGSHPLTETWKEFKRPLDPDRREFADFSGVVSYSPLPYLPQAVAIAFGRLLNFTPLGLLYLGRLSNALGAIAIIFWALKVLPTGREAALVIAMFPMAQFEYASVAPDASIIATSYLFTAIALRATARRRWSYSDIFACVASGSVFCSVKPVYAPLLAVGLPAVLSLRATTGRRVLWRILIANATVCCGVMVVTVAWLISAWNTRIIGLSGDSIWHQVSFITTHPISYAAVLGADLVQNARHYVADTIGIFGVSKVYLPIYIYYLAVGTLITAAAFPVSKTEKIPAMVSIWYVGLMFIVFILIQTALFVMLPIGDFGGLQGRYLLPLGALAAATLTSAMNSREPRSGARGAYILVLGALCWITVMMEVTIVRDYQVL